MKQQWVTSEVDNWAPLPESNFNFCLHKNKSSDCRKLIKTQLPMYPYTRCLKNNMTLGGLNESSGIGWKTLKWRRSGLNKISIWRASDGSEPQCWVYERVQSVRSYSHCAPKKYYLLIFLAELQILQRITKAK